MEDAIQRHGLEQAETGSFGGSSIWMKAPKGVNTTKLAQVLKAQGVLIEPGQPFFAPEDRNTRFYRLGYSSIPIPRIEGGIAKIAETLANWP